MSKTSIYQSVREIDEKLRELNRERETLIERAQLECNHPKEALLESPSSDRPPVRVCTLCGRAEEGWGSGYKHLAPFFYEVATMSRDLLFERYVLKFYMHERCCDD